MTPSKQWEQIFAQKFTSKKEQDDIQSGFEDWALRVYFGEKNRNKPWYSTEVTKESVLDRFFLASSPISPENLLNLYLELPALRKALQSFDSKNREEAALDTDADEQVTYISGEITLKQIADKLGGITGTMVNKLFQSGIEKMKQMTGNVHPEEIEPDDWYIFEKKVNQAVEVTSLRYAILLFASRNHEEFLDTLIAESIITQKEAKLVSQDEKDGLDILRNEYPVEITSLILASDYEEDESLFSTFQSAVSKQLFPRRKKAQRDE
jgi:hypothetical protein